MRRLTVSFTDAQFAWVQEQADDRDRPKKWVIQQAVDAARGEESAYSDVVPPGDTSTDQAAPGDTSIHQRVDELEQRVADLEAGGTSDDVRVSSESAQPSPESEHRNVGDTSNHDDDHTGAASPDSEAALDELLREWRPGGSTDERRASARAVLEYLQDRGSATRSDLVNDVYPTDGVDSQSENTWWRTTARGQLDDGTGGALAIGVGAGLVKREQGPPHVYRWVG